MANQIINIGNQINDGTGDSIRDAFEKVNSNFSDLYNVAGLGDGLQFIKLREFSPNPNSPNTLQANTFLGISTSGQTIVQRTLTAGDGISLVLSDGQLLISNTASTLSSDPSPTLGGNLNGFGHRGINFGNPLNDQDVVTKLWVYENFLNRDGIYEHDIGTTPTDVLPLVDGVPNFQSSTIRTNPLIVNTATNYYHPTNKGYVDTKLSLAGVNSIDPATQAVNTSMGYMTGPLILSRNPVTQDDTDYNGLVAATKYYVDNSAFVSSVNFFVSLDGRDNRTDIPSYKKGRAMAYAFKTITAAAAAAEQQIAISQVVLGPYQKTITTDGGLSNVTIQIIEASPYVSGATRLTVGWSGNGGVGTDAYLDGSIFPGMYVIGEFSGAIGLIEKIQAKSSPEVEIYDVVPVDYAETLTSALTPIPSATNNGGTTGTVVLQFVTPNLVNIPDFWLGYVFTCDTGGQGIVSNVGYYTDPVTGNVYDQLTVNFTVPLVNSNAIPGSNWHVYSNFFALGEGLQYGQFQEKNQITIIVESGEHENQYPIKISDNVSVRGDEFRRSLVKPAKFVNSDIATISTSPWVNTYFRRDTQVDGLLVAQLDTSVDYTSTGSFILTAVPDGSQNNATTGVVTFTVSATYDGNPVSGFVLDPAWVGYVFTGNGGQGEITAILANTFQVNLAQNASFLRELNNANTLNYGSWHVYAPVNHGYHYLRDARYPVNYVIPYQAGNYLTAKELLTLNRTYIQSEISAWIQYNISQNSGHSNTNIWNSSSFITYFQNADSQALCYRDVGLIVDAICADLDAGNVSNCLTAADSYSSVVNVENYEKLQTVAAFEQIGVMAQRIVQNIPTGDTGTNIISYQTTEKQVYTETYEPDQAVITPVIGFSLLSTGTIVSSGSGYDYPPSITFVGGGGTGAAGSVTLNAQGQITAFNVTNTGTGYTSAPTIVVTPTGATPSANASLSVSLAPTGSIKSVKLTQPGQGYTTLPSLTVVGDGVGAVVTCTVAQVGAFWEISSIGLVNSGNGYSEAYVFINGGSTSNSLTGIQGLVSGIASIVGGNSSFNPPKYNDELDVFLMNDATMIRYISAQGHGGFMKVLDPSGQIKAKSPYTQTASSFSKSYNRQVFSGGMLVDGFTGNLQMVPNGVTQAVADTETGTLTQIPVKRLVRKPQCPTFFVNNGITYEVDFVSEFQLDESTINNPTPTYTGVLNLNPARPGGIQYATVTGSGFKAGSTLPITFSSPTAAGGVVAQGTVYSSDGTLGNNAHNVTMVTSGVGYLTTAVSLVVGGATISYSLNATGSINTSTAAVINPGSGYAVGCAINFTGPGVSTGVTATAYVGTVSTSGGIESIVWTNSGSNYVSLPSYSFGTGFTSNVTIQNGYIGTLPSNIECITAGNRSMLANDFTQINDLGYGIFVTNGGFMENVSMFTYYCWTSYYALNGAQIRTITGSSAYGIYGLVSEGSDPNEVPISMANQNDYVAASVQFFNTGSYANVVNANVIYATIGTDYGTPYGGAEIEVNHYGTRKIYEVTSISPLSVPGLTNYYEISIDGTAGTWLQTMGAGEVLQGTYRAKYQMNFTGFNPSVLTRSAVVFNLKEDPSETYKVSETNYQGNDVTTITTRNSYDYISLTPFIENYSNLARQGVYNIVTNGGSGYTSGTSVTVTFATPTSVTASVTTATGATSTSSAILSSLSGQIHIGMTATSSANTLNGNVVTWASYYGGSTTTFRVGFLYPVVNLQVGETVTFHGTPAIAQGVANSNGVITDLLGNLNSLTVIESGTGYSNSNNGSNGPLPVSSTTATLHGSSVSAGNLSVSQALVSGLATTTTFKIVSLDAALSGRISQGLASSTPYYYIFGYEGGLFKITGYVSSEVSGQAWDLITVQRINQNGTNYSSAYLSAEMMGNNLYAGIQKNQTALLTQKISTLRATSHDMVDVGTGGYADSKIPNDLYGPPRNSHVTSNEVLEIGKGRVFYVTTDQDGTFSVGGLLVVDQATGSVNLNAPVNIGTLPTLHLSKGLTVDTISGDTAMTDDSDSVLVTEKAIVGFIERRLGTSVNSVGTSLGLIGPGYLDLDGIQGMTGNINMKGDNINSHKIFNLENPSDGQDAATRSYVDTRIHLAGTNATYYNGSSLETHPEWGVMTGPLILNSDPTTGSVVRYSNNDGNVATTKRYVDQTRQISTASDVALTAQQDQDFLMFSNNVLSVNTTSAKPIWNSTNQIVNVRNNTATTVVNTPTSRSGGSDIDVVRVNNTITMKLLGSAASGSIGPGSLPTNTAEQNNPITDYHVSSLAAIRQYKLLMTEAITTATPPAGTQQQVQSWSGVTSFDASQFTLTSGWASLQTSTSITTGIPLNRIQQAPANAEATGLKGGIVGTTSTAANNVTYLSSATVVNYLEALTRDGRSSVRGNLLPDVPAYSGNSRNLGSSSYTWNGVYADTFHGTATQAISLLSSLAPQTYVTATTATINSSIVQRDATGNINGIFVVDYNGSIIPSQDLGSTVGSGANRFGTVFAQSISAGGFGIAGNFEGIWTLGTPAGGTSYLLGNSLETTNNGSFIGAKYNGSSLDNTSHRMAGVYSRSFGGDDARFLGMTVTNTINAQTLSVSGTAGAGTLTLSNPLDSTYGGTGANNAGTGFNNLIVAAAGGPASSGGQVLVSYGQNNYSWQSYSGGASAIIGTVINSSHQNYTAVSGSNTFTAPSSYKPATGQLRIYVNGVRQSLSNADYSEGSADSNGNASTFTITCNAGDNVYAEVDGYITYNFAANAITFSPSGSIPSGDTTVQQALSFVDSDKMRKSGGTFTGPVSFNSGETLTVSGGTTGAAGLVMPAGTLLNTPVIGAIEFDGSGLYFTQTSGPTRQQVATESWVGNQGYVTATGSVAYATSAGSVAWSGLTGTAPNVSTFSNNAGYLTSSGTIANATSAVTAGTANGLNTSNNYQINSLGVGASASGNTGEIRATGDITAFYSASDVRLKENVSKITGALDKVLQINGYQYNYIGSKTQLVGVMAGELIKVLPEAVYESTPPGVEENKEDPYLAVRYDLLVPLLLEAIKELKAEVDALKAGK